MVSDEFLQRLAEEERNTRYEDGILCPYCETEQDTETTYAHVSYWGEDSKDKITCEHCNKEFWVEEKVERKFKTTTIEWEEKERLRLDNLSQEGEKERLRLDNLSQEGEKLK